MSDREEKIASAKAVPIEQELAARGIELRGQGINRTGPCPVCGGRDRFGVNIAKQVWNCRGCDLGGGVIRLVQHLDHCNFVTALDTLAGKRPRAVKTAPLRTSRSDTKYDQEQHRKAAWLWSQREPIAGTPADRYLLKRGIICRAPTIGYLAPARPDHHPALIAAYGIPDEIESGIMAKPRTAKGCQIGRMPFSRRCREGLDRAGSMVVALAAGYRVEECAFSVSPGSVNKKQGMFRRHAR